MNNISDNDYRGNLLLIDDEKEVIKSLYRQFRKKYNVFLAYSAAQGLEIMAENSIQVIISDQRMPGMTGTEFYKTIKTEYPDAIRLILTGYADIQTIVAAINDGNIFRYILKPWDPIELESIVSEAFQRFNLIADNRILLEQLHEAKSTLEKRVEERTRELSKTNERLQEINRQKDELLIQYRNEIRERKKAEKELEIAKISAENANRAKSDFLAIMSHEIRTPMNSIIGMTELTLHTPLNDEQKENLHAVKDSANHLLRIINDILDFSKIEAGKIILDPTDFDLRSMLNAVMKSFDVHVRNKNLFLNLKISDDIPRVVRGDRQRIRQILINLIGNACKFTGRGGVTVTVSFYDETIKRSPDMANGHFILFTVEDTGIGIHPDKHETIFSSFSQGDSFIPKKYGGTGLGLAITQKLIEHMKGKIWLSSEIGNGSIFFFYIYLEPGDSRKIVNDSADIQSRFDRKGRSLNILLAEDNSLNAAMASRLLEKIGHRVVSVKNGVQVIQALAENDFDIVLMDVEMPEMDGFEATRRIRRSEAGENKQNIPIIAMTAHAMPGFKSECLKVGMNDYVAKPFDINRLNQVLDKCC